MKIGIYSNLTRDIQGNVTKKAIAYLEDRRVEYYLCDELRDLELKGIYLDKTALAKTCDLMILFGGDGTILRIVKECAENDCKIFSINVGRLGFLTDVDKLKDKMETALDTLLTGKTTQDSRSMLTITCKGKQYVALNEVVITRGALAKLVTVGIAINGNAFDTVNGDGMIVCTPTGSTAYSLSCGGPIMSPDVGGFCITPVSPHSLHSRPMIVGAKNHITLKVIKAFPHAHLNIDGEDIAEIFDGDTVSIAESMTKVIFVRLEGYDFYGNLMKKLYF